MLHTARNLLSAEVGLGKVARQAQRMQYGLDGVGAMVNGDAGGDGTVQQRDYAIDDVKSGVSGQAWWEACLTSSC